MLKDIPGLGALFSSTSESPTRKELMVLIRPTVLKTPELASLAAQAERHEMSWHWVKGHSGHPENERADELANQGLDARLSEA